MKYLVDTHVFLWLVGSPDKVPETTHAALADPDNELLVSAVSAMEVATKTRLGKLPDSGLLATWERRVVEIGATDLPLATAAALTAGTMAWEHRDPFDRLLAAQAIHEAAVFVTVDRAFAHLSAPQVLTW